MKVLLSLKTILSAMLSVLILSKCVEAKELKPPLPSIPMIDVHEGFCRTSAKTLWWDAYALELKDSKLATKWVSWILRVDDLIIPHAENLLGSPGVGVFHVTVAQDGTISEIRPYRDLDFRFRAGKRSEFTMARLEQLIKHSAPLPAFPAGSQLREFHLIVEGYCPESAIRFGVNEVTCTLY